MNRRDMVKGAAAAVASAAIPLHVGRAREPEYIGVDLAVPDSDRTVTRVHNAGTHVIEIERSDGSCVSVDPGEFATIEVNGDRVTALFDSEAFKRRMAAAVEIPYHRLWGE